MIRTQHYTLIMRTTHHAEELWIDNPTRKHTLTADRNGGHKHKDAYQADSITVKWSHK